MKSKTADARAREADEIRRQLVEAGLAQDDDAAKPIFDALDEFAREGYGVTKTWKVNEGIGGGVAITLLLSTQPHVVSYARLHPAHR